MNRDEIIEAIIRIEYKMFDKVNNRGGRADCQDDFPTFHIMRSAQFHAWDDASVESYYEDAKEAEAKGWNLPMEKYARMMESTAPAEYEEIKDQLPEVSEEKRAIIKNEIMPVMMRQTEAFMKAYPKFIGTSRPVHSESDRMFTSIETYLGSELYTYSEKTLRAYRDWLLSEDAAGRSVVEKIYENTAKLYGYDSVADAEASIR